MKSWLLVEEAEPSSPPVILALGSCKRLQLTLVGCVVLGVDEPRSDASAGACCVEEA